VRDQKPYELFNGRLAMLGITFALIGDTVTGGSGMGPLEQLNIETAGSDR
jgi:photosystem II protein